MRKTIILFIIFCFISCKKETEEIIKYDKDGNIVSKIYISEGLSLDSVIYISSGKIDTKCFFKKASKTECYVKHYDKIGISSEGNTKNKKKIGNWKYYNSKGKVSKVVEFKTICNEEYPNQEWNYKSDGKLNNEFSNYFTYKIGGQITIDGTRGNNLIIQYNPMFKKGAICTINLSQKINDNFCNVDSVEKFHFKSENNFSFNLPLKSEDIKEGFILKGYIEEHHFKEDIDNKNLLNHKTRRVYIDIPIKEK